jgi:uncharacterized protein YkwD
MLTGRYWTVVSISFLGLLLSACGGSNNVSSSTNSVTPDTSTGDIQVEGNKAPVAALDISGSLNVTSGATVTVDGSGSSDPDGDSINFSWSQTQGTALNLSDLSNPSLNFVAPSVEQPSRVVFRLTVSDGALSDSIDVEILISPLADTTPPSIVSRSPRGNATNVATTADISVTLDEPLLVSSIDNQSLLVDQSGSNVSGSISYDSINYRIVFKPDAALAENSSYQVSIAASVQDEAGNSLQAESWTFTTGSAYNLGQTPQSTIDLCMDDADMQMLTLVNNARAVARICGTTNHPATAALSWECRLEQAAQGHSASMADNDYHDHTGIDGSSPGDRITAAGYPWTAYGENIAGGYGTAEAVMSAWLQSPGHCSNLMSAWFTEMGAAAAENPLSTYRIYWTQNFGDR